VSALLEKNISQDEMISIWFGKVNPLESDKPNLICLPYAGGGSLIFKNWLKDSGISNIARVCPVHLPGRETRIKEQFAKSIPSLANSIASTLLTSHSPTIIFGHSMGALIALELAHALKKAKFKPPVLLIVSGACPPHVRQHNTPVAELSNQDLTNKIKAMQSSKASALDNPELAKLFLPIIRADFTLCDQYQYEHSSSLDMPILAMSGVDDPSAHPDKMLAWTDYTISDFEMMMFYGDHFFIEPQESLLINRLTSIIQTFVEPHQGSHIHSTVKL